MVALQEISGSLFVTYCYYSCVSVVLYINRTLSRAMNREVIFKPDGNAA